ncbi:hypothetical protein BHE74_00019913, partial [Ensete ventricosum]
TLPRGSHPCGRHLHGRHPYRHSHYWRQPLRSVPLPVGCLFMGAEPAVDRPLWAGRLQTIGSNPCGVAAGGCRSLREPRCSRPPSGGCTCGLATGARHTHAGWPWPQPAAPLHGGRSRSPLAGSLAAASRPPAGRPWLQPIAPCRGPGRSRPPPCRGALAVAGRPCKRVGRGHALLPLERASFTEKMQQECIK